MKFVAVSILAAASVFALASSRAPAPADDGLEEVMQTLQGNLKRADKAFDAKDAAKLLPAILEMEQAAHAAKMKTPPKAEEIKDAKQKEAFVQGFHVQMIELQKNLLDVEAALVQGKTDDARKQFDDKVKATKKAGHDKYKE